MTDILWYIIIYPIQLLLEVVFSIFQKSLNNPGFAIIGVSIVVSTLALPLYKKADSLQDEERNKQKSMEKWIKHIKKTFNGDKRYMILSAYYQEQGYKPFYALKDSYTVLDDLKNHTHVTEDESNNFFELYNCITHDPCELKLYDYVPSDDAGKSNENLETGVRKAKGKQDLIIDSQFHYHANMAAYLLFAKWFDFLRENDVYDNTRIIIVSDHGGDLKQFDDMIIDENADAESLNPILLFKDFNTSGFLTDDTFMTNAEVPFLATNKIIDNPKNPYTGNSIKSEKEKEQLVVFTFNSSALDGENTFDMDKYNLYTVHDNIFDKSNWKKVN